MNSRPSILSSRPWNNFFAFVLTGAAASILFQKSPGGCGDYPQNFQVLYIGLGIGAIAGLIFHAVYPKIPHAYIVQPALLTVIRYFLASIILSYGFAKVFAGQFPHIMANMDARMVELTPMRVAWAFFGYSKGYQMYLGWGEVIPALMLLFRRTTLLGAFFMLIVMLNVFLVNVFFDVCVKLNSGIYTALALYIVLQETRRLWNFFLANKITGPRVDITLQQPKWLKITGNVVSGLAIIGILVVAGMAVTQYYSNSNRITQTPVQGPWKVVNLFHWNENQWKIKDRSDSLFANRIFFDGLNGVITSDLIRDRFRFSVDSASNHLTVNFTNNRNEWNSSPLKWKFEKISPDSLRIWARWKKDSLQMHFVLRREKLTRY